MYKNIAIAILLAYIAGTTYFTTIGARFVVAERVSGWHETRAAYERHNSQEISKILKVSMPRVEGIN